MGDQPRLTQRATGITGDAPGRTRNETARWRWPGRSDARHTAVLLGPVGAVLFAAGLGLVPHLLKNGLTLASVVSVVLLICGSVTVIGGARTILRDRTRVIKFAGTAATVLLVGVATSIVAPAVAATIVPATHIGSTPAANGMDFEVVTLTTADKVKLAAWYLRGTNRAAVVVMHGAGSTRSAVLDQAAVLVEAGYSCLLVDARGHGDSQGTAMDFGWYGDLDIKAGTDFLASREEIDAHRIGVVGFSMGGEEAIGSAATNTRVRAVVAEGATGRRASDKDWLSDVYGWRGRLQERMEAVQDRVTDLLTAAPPPVALRSAVAESAGTQFLLITAGRVDDEGRAASFIKSGAADRVTVWEVDRAGHVGGFHARPEEWRQRTVAFLDKYLN